MKNDFTRPVAIRPENSEGMILRMAGDDKPGRNFSGGKRRGPGFDRKAPQRSSRAAIVWLILFLVLAGLLLFKGYGPARAVEFSQSEFEEKLAAMQIVSVEMTWENGNVMACEGKFRRQGSSTVQVTTTPVQSPREGEAELRANTDETYKTRVVYTDALARLLKQSGANVVVKPTRSARNPALSNPSAEGSNPKLR